MVAASPQSHLQPDKKLVIARAPHLGWRVREERDNVVVREVEYEDWHRVERALMLFNIEAGTEPFDSPAVE
jgi:hypothetical protein